MNVFESIWSDLRRPMLPLHGGEAFFLWSYFLGVAEARALMLVTCNHTRDQDLRELIEHMIDDVMEPQIARLAKLMQDEGIPMPVVTPDPPKAKPEEIPPGARLVDIQVARMVVVKVEGLLQLAWEGIRFSQRSDVSALFSQFAGQVAAQGYTMRELLIKRGWFPMPPAFGTSSAGG